ncbi:MAG: hypothetical protein DIZ80_08110 [endosymbiont of Galathealinum brachiosum]|uniref:Dystroglycan-type cadherin-like domain-containing protein n=1 Tax=endosymbiont of Galathealinum brachiosum TaxID=2200906 RepID=A0A370DIV0_9GAMM|nr:MAG: hypothetical protein DIZ80_08110 [endosymbiont of Galathealinum brachiosum]
MNNSISSLNFKFPFLVLLLSLLTACGGGSSDGASNSESLTADYCALMTPSVLQGESGDVVNIITSEQIEKIRFDVVGIDTIASYEFFPGVVSGEGYFFTIPVLPEFGMEGGEAKLYVSQGEKSCDLGMFTIDALPVTVRENTTSKTIDALDTTMQNLFLSYGFDATTHNPATTTNPVHFQLGILNDVLYGNGEASLDAMRQSFASLSDEDRLLLDSLIGKLNLDLEMIKIADAHAVVAPVVLKTTTQTDNNIDVNFPKSQLILQKVTDLSVRPLLATDTCAPDFIDAQVSKEVITTAEGLSNAMLEAKKAQDRIDNPEFNATNVGTMLNMAGFAGPAGTTVAVIGGASLLIMDFSNKKLARLLPTKINIKLEVTPSAYIEEDYMEWSGNAAPIWRASATATSEGMNLTKTMLDSALTASNVAPISSISSSTLLPFSEAANRNFDDRNGVDCLSVPSYSWPNLDVSGDAWITAEIDGSSFILENHRKLKPVTEGDSILTVKLNKELFPVVSGTLGDTEKDITIGNNPKRVTYTQSRVKADSPGAEVEFTAVIENSKVPESYMLEVSPATLVSEAVIGNQVRFTIKTPDNKDLFPVTVKLTSLSMELEVYSPTEGSAEAYLNVDVKLDRQDALSCVEIGDEVSLLATVTGANDETVTWLPLSGATLVDGGNNLARITPAQEGNIVISARSNEDPDVVTEYSLRVQKCDARVFTYLETASKFEGPETLGTCPNQPPEYVTEDTSVYGEMIDPGVSLIHPLDVTNGVTLNFSHALAETVTSHGDGCNTYNNYQSASLNGSVGHSANSGEILINATGYVEGSCAETGIIDRPPECKTGESLLLLSATHYFNHTQETTYNLSIDLSCNLVDWNYNLSGGALANWRQIIFIRDENDNDVPVTDLLDIASIADMSEFVAPRGCNDSTGSLLQLNKQMTLLAPPENKTYFIGFNSSLMFGIGANPEENMDNQSINISGGYTISKQ